MRSRRAPRRRTVATGTYTVSCCGAGRIHIQVSDASGSVTFTAAPEDAYEFAQDILRGYDEAVGIAPQNPLLQF